MFMLDVQPNPSGTNRQTKCFRLRMAIVSVYKIDLISSIIPTPDMQTTTLLLLDCSGRYSVHMAAEPQSKNEQRVP